jgi:3-oxoadipate enol-lactonase
MVEDAASFIQAQAHSPVIFAGLSMGGMVGQGLAAAYPDLLSHLIIANSAGTYTPAQRDVFLQRPNLVLAKGMAAIADGTMERWFSADFRTNEPEQVNATKAVLLHNQPAAYAYSAQAVAHIDFRADWASIKCPTLLIGSDADLATPLACSEQIHAGLVNATRKQLVNIPSVGHLSVIEKPDAFAQAMLSFLQ